ncbi:sulfatase family protein [Mesorhizobium sp. 10J20-29]
MNIIYIDIDSLRADHLGCYGYARNTSPNIDALAKEGTVFSNVYISDAPCLPSRTALWSGRFGFRTGVVGHGGTAAAPFNQGTNRGFYDAFLNEGWMRAFRDLGFHTATVSSFGERHSAWHWYAGFNEVMNPGLGGMESADTVVRTAIDWIDRRSSSRESWFLHVNLWDPHTPYRVPEEFGDPFANEPGPEWLDQNWFEAASRGYGPHSIQEPNGFDGFNFEGQYPRAPVPISSLVEAKAWIDGYDTGIFFADFWIGKLIDKLKSSNLYDKTIVMIGADHGENLGELGVWADHHTADHPTCHVPMVVRMPGQSKPNAVDHGLHYQIDLAATLIELSGGQVPVGWDGRSFAEDWRNGSKTGRDFLVTSQGAWACQRGIRFNAQGTRYLCLITYHDGYKDFAPWLLFDLTQDPYERQDLSTSRPDLVAQAARFLCDWQLQMMLTSDTDVDPLMTVLREGGPFHCRGELGRYLARLKETGREEHAQVLLKRHPEDAKLTVEQFRDKSDKGTAWNPLL